MSFLDDVVSIGKSVTGFLGGSGLGSTLAKTALLGLALNQVNKSINKDNSKPDPSSNQRQDTKTREQLQPSTDNAIPVIYGSAFVRGIITDAVQVDRKYMWYCITVCEVTGKVNLGTGADSSITFKEFYINKGKVTFQGDGVTVAAITDDDGNVNSDINGLVKIYCYKDGSVNPVAPFGYTIPGLTAAYGVMPNWNSTMTMDKLAFCIVRVEYNKEKGVTSLGEIEFKIENSMTEPGDCVYDYMTNTRYGAGIPPAEIYIS